MSLGGYSLSFLVCAGAVLCGCQEPVADSSAMPSGQPTQVLKGFEMNDVRNGSNTMTLQSTEARIYEAQHIADVDQPRLFFYKKGVVSSRLNAPRGRLQLETHEVQTWGGVTVISADSSTLKTESLRYDPKAQTISSTDTVHLEKTDSITDGIGIVTDPDLKSVKIGKQKVRFKKGMSQ